MNRSRRSAMWSMGDVIEYRNVHHGRPWWVVPARVVEDSDDRVVVWWPAGTRYLRPVGDDRTESLRQLAENRWDLLDAHIWASADLSTWNWKDEDELEVGEQVGLYSPDDVVRIRAAGARVIELIERRDAVFDDWREWTAPTEWLAFPPALDA